MFGLFKKKTNNEHVVTQTIQIKGMHCTSCAMNIDGELEELPGVQRAETHFASGKTTITYDPTLINQPQLSETIKKLGYTATFTS
jgi:copper chaperone CopZ